MTTCADLIDRLEKKGIELDWEEGNAHLSGNKTYSIGITEVYQRGDGDWEILMCLDRGEIRITVYEEDAMQILVASEVDIT